MARLAMLRGDAARAAALMKTCRRGGEDDGTIAIIGALSASIERGIDMAVEAVVAEIRRRRLVRDVAVLQASNALRGPP